MSDDYHAPKGVGIGCLSALVALIILGLPAMVHVVLIGGVCEGAPRPCTPPGHPMVWVVAAIVCAALIGFAVVRIANARGRGK